MNRIGRNDPCHCGSGKKYKKCCFEKDESVNILPWPEVSEEEVVNQLIGSSEQFKEYYQKERPKISNKLIWALDRSLPEGTDCLFQKLKNNDYVIRLKTTSSLQDIPTEIAHELEHAVVDSEGFNGISCTDRKAQNTCVALNDMILDLLVNAKLKEYGFDFGFEDDTDLPTATDHLDSLKLNKLSRLEWIFYYASDLLEQNLLGINPNEEAQKFYKNKFPEIANQAEELFMLVKENEYDTPQKAANLYEKIMRKYNLSNVMLVNN